MGEDDPARIIHDCAQAIGVERAGHVGRRGALATEAGHE